MNPIPINMPGSMTYHLREYNGPECRENEDRPLDFDLYLKILSEG